MYNPTKHQITHFNELAIFFLVMLQGKDQGHHKCFQAPGCVLGVASQGGDGRERIPWFQDERDAPNDHQPASQPIINGSSVRMLILEASHHPVSAKWPRFRTACATQRTGWDQALQPGPWG